MAESFDDMRPYSDAEMVSAVSRFVETPEFVKLAGFMFPGKPLPEVRDFFLSIKTVYELQHKIMFGIYEVIKQKSMKDFTYSGVEYLDPTKSYLFISNHRDIVLDAYLLQCLFVMYDIPLTQVTFGANLMRNPIIRLAGKCNRMFKVERGGPTPREFYMALSRLSQYIRHTIRETHDSVWIAQRNGRTKDGMDRTEVALVKMLGLSGGKDKVEAFDNLNIVPLSISYEWEPCDVLKALELCRTAKFGHYEKGSDEDFNSIFTGINSQKGLVHLSINKPITREELADLCSEDDFNEALAQLLDSRILGGYKLMPSNYAAYDIRNASDEYSSHYTPECKAMLLDKINNLPKVDDIDSEMFRKQFVDIYANPVENCKMMADL